LSNVAGYFAFGFYNDFIRVSINNDLIAKILAAAELAAGVLIHNNFSIRILLCCYNYKTPMVQ